eukprot:m.186064 g.186064  ORF g.186064 m.186064 type:complete len:279 (+) comp16918_c0_seq3:55-891(+)
MADATMGVHSRRHDALRRLSLCKPTHAPPTIPERSQSESTPSSKQASAMALPVTRERSATDITSLTSQNKHETVVLIRNGRVLENADTSQTLSNEHKRAIAKAVKSGRIAKSEASDVETDLRVALQLRDVMEVHAILQRLAGEVTAAPEVKMTSATGLAPQALGTLTDQERMDIMIQVKEGKISQDEAMRLVSSSVTQPSEPEDITLVEPVKPVTRKTSSSRLSFRSKATAPPASPRSTPSGPPRHAPPPPPPATKPTAHPPPPGLRPPAKPKPRQAW